MSNRVHLKPRIKLVDGAWEVIPPKAIHVPNLVKMAEQFCDEKNMDLEVRCGCGHEYGMPNADDGRYYCNRGHGGAFHCAP
jgi:hypothetical protein